MMLTVVPVVQAEAFYDVSLDGEWGFKYYANSNEVPKDVAGIVFEDKIQVPGAMEMQGYGYPSYFYEEMTGWGMTEDDGVRSAGVYKTEFKCTGENYLVFESVEDNLTVYLNGEKLVDSRNGEMGTAVKFEGKGDNEIICVVERNNSGINKKDDFNLSGFMGSVYVTKSITVEKASKKVEIKDNKLVIDGKAVVLKGVKYTPTHPEAGNSITDGQIKKDLELIKEYGFNAVWVSGAPDALYVEAENLGLYVIDEANVNLAYADRDMEAAKARVEEMVERHFGYKSIIMWSVGSGEGGQNLINSVKELDNRPVAQEVNFAPDFKVFGNTGGMSDWVDSLGDGNVGGFVDEFADKELYYTQNAYLFDVKDTVTGETVTVDGEVENYMGVQYLGDATFVRNIDKMDNYTIVTELSAVDGDRVIFESGNVKFEVRGGRARFNVGDARARADVYEGKIAAVYRDGEIQIFVNDGFKENAQADATVEGEYKIGGGETAIKYVEIYNDALTLDELLEGADEKKLISRVAFEDISIKEDKSYTFLAYGGDFGDNPNSYYKCLTGIFSSTREPHPEAEALKQLLAEKSVIGMATVSAISAEDAKKVTPAEDGTGVVWSADKFEVQVGFDGKITSYVSDGKELLTDAMYPTVLREKTLSEYEMGIEQEERWRALSHRVEEDVLYVEVMSTVTDGKLCLAYYMTEDGSMHVSMQSQFAEDSNKPTFIGFRGAGNFEKAEWVGKELSSYPDRESHGATTLYSLDVADMEDNYTIAQENGNKAALKATLTGADGKVLSFGAGLKSFNFQAHNYSPYALDEAERSIDIKKEDKAYFRVGGYIAGLGENSKYKLNNNIYGFDFTIMPFDADYVYHYGAPLSIKAEGNKEFTDFTHSVKTYVYKTNKGVEVTGAVQDEKKAVVGDYTIYFAPDTEYMSDMAPLEKKAEMALDGDFNGNKLAVRGNGWDPGVTYDKGIVLKNGSVTYDVTNFNDHVFNAVIGKMDFDWRRMGGGFDRNMFNASVDVTIALDGEVVEEVKDVSMRGGSKAVSIDVSKAKAMTITVKGNGAAPSYEDAVIANAAFVPNGPVIVNFEKLDGKATITVLNTDEEYVDVVLTGIENGVVTTEAVSMGKGLYRTVEVKAGENAVVKAYITGIGEVGLE